MLGESDEVDPDATDGPPLTLTSGNASTAIMLEASALLSPPSLLRLLTSLRLPLTLSACFRRLPQASHFNEHNGHWEPVVEPWHIAGWWIGVSEPAGAVSGSGSGSGGSGERERRNSNDDTRGERGYDGEGEGGPREGGGGTRSAHTITLTADDVLNVNVTHAMLVSAIEVSAGCRERRRE